MASTPAKPRELEQITVKSDTRDVLAHAKQYGKKNGLDDTLIVDIVEREPVAAEDLAWMYHFEEARWIQYRMKPHVDTRVVNPFNKIEVEKNVTFGLRSNSDGFRGDEIRAKQPGVTRIVTIGASSTFGWGVEPEHTFQHILETKLNKRQPGRYEIINLGIPGQNSRHGLGMLRHYALPLQPDLLVIEFRGKRAGESKARPDPLHREILAVRGKTIERVIGRDPLALAVEQQHPLDRLLVALLKRRPARHVRLANQQDHPVRLRLSLQWQCQ